MKGWVSYGFELWFLYLMGYAIGFAAIISAAWCFLNLAGWVFFG
jgi:hypothetical protein